MSQGPSDPKRPSPQAFALATLDSYDFPVYVIAEVLGITEATVCRRRPRLWPRVRREIYPGEVTNARKIAMTKLLQAEYRVQDIAQVGGVSPATVYRHADELVKVDREVPHWYQRMYADLLVRNSEPPSFRAWNRERRARRWRTKGRSHGAI